MSAAVVIAAFLILRLLFGALASMRARGLPASNMTGHDDDDLISPAELLRAGRTSSLSSGAETGTLPSEYSTTHALSPSTTESFDSPEDSTSCTSSFDELGSGSSLD